MNFNTASPSYTTVISRRQNHSKEQVLQNFNKSKRFIFLLPVRFYKGRSTFTPRWMESDISRNNNTKYSWAKKTRFSNMQSWPSGREETTGIQGGPNFAIWPRLIPPKWLVPFHCVVPLSMSLLSSIEQAIHYAYRKAILDENNPLQKALNR